MSDLISRQMAIEVVQNRHIMLNKEKVLLINDLEKLPSAQLVTDTNVGCKLVIDPHKIERAIRGLTEWQKHVQTESDIDRDISVAVEALKAQLGTNLAEVGTDCISRQNAIEVIERARAHIGHNMERAVGRVFLEMLDDVGLSISKLPSAKPKRGKWIRTGSGSLYDHYECSECGKAPKWECMGDNRWKIAFTDFCPNCGAKMDEVTA